MIQAPAPLKPFTGSHRRALRTACVPRASMRFVAEVADAPAGSGQHTSILQRGLQLGQSILSSNTDVQQGLNALQQGLSGAAAGMQQGLDAAKSGAQLPQVQLPEFSTPSIQLPEISAPNLQLPELPNLGAGASSLVQRLSTSRTAAPDHPSILQQLQQQLSDAQQTGSLPRLEVPDLSQLPSDLSQLPSDLLKQLPDAEQVEAKLRELLPDLPALPPVDVNLAGAGDALTGIFQSWNTPPAVWATGIDWTPVSQLVAGAWRALIGPFQVFSSGGFFLNFLYIVPLGVLVFALIIKAPKN